MLRFAQADSLAVPAGSNDVQNDATAPATTEAHVSAPRALNSHNNVSRVADAPVL